MRSGVKLVFFGGGPVAEASLADLQEYCEVEAVITKPTTFESMVKTAKTNQVYKVSDKHELTEFIKNCDFKSKIGVIVDFGVIVEQAVIDFFKKGIVNSHFSLLPEWRGADPISFSILNGDKKSGVSLMLIDSGLDTGDLLAQKSHVIKPRTTTPELTDQLIELSNQLLRTTLQPYIDGSIKPWKQPNAERASYSRKLTKADGVLDWSKSADILDNEIRAFLGWPNSRTRLANKDVIITQAQVAKISGQPGSIKADKKQLIIYCGQNALEILSLKPAGKNEMSAQAFLNGHLHLL